MKDVVLTRRACRRFRSGEDIGKLLGRNGCFVGPLGTATPRVETCQALKRCCSGCHGDREIGLCPIWSCTLGGDLERVGNPRNNLGNRKRVFVASSI